MTWLELKLEAVCSRGRIVRNNGRPRARSAAWSESPAETGTQGMFSLSQAFLMMVSVHRGGGGGRKIPSGALGNILLSSRTLR